MTPLERFRAEAEKDVRELAEQIRRRNVIVDSDIRRIVEAAERLLNAAPRQ